MKTKLIVSVFAALLVSLALVVIGCSGEEIIPVIESFKVIFDADDGTPAPDEQNIKSGSKLTDPGVITKEGHTFDGWFTKANFTSKWDFAIDTVDSPMTLCARWVIPVNEGGFFTETIEIDIHPVTKENCSEVLYARRLLL